MVHPWVLAVSNNQEAVDPTSESQELNDSPDMLCVLIIGIVQTRGVYDGALTPICDPSTRDLFGFFGARVGSSALVFGLLPVVLFFDHGFRLSL